MIQPDFNKLNVPLSGTKLACNSDLCWREFAVALSFFNNYCTYKVTEEEIADIIKSLINWTNRRDYIQYKIKVFSVTPNRFVEGQIKLGDIFLVDLGINYKPECSYMHPALVIEEIGNMVVIIPTSSNTSKVNDAYNSSTKTGKWYYKKVDTSNGFNSECVLLLNNLKVVSKGRLLEKKSQLSENINDIGSLFNEIKGSIYEHYLPKQYINNLKLSQENDRLKAEIIDLNKKIATLSEKV